MRRNKRMAPWRAILILLLLCTGLLFFFEWLGSERSQKWVEEPVKLPAKTQQPARNKD